MLDCRSWLPPQFLKILPLAGRAVKAMSRKRHYDQITPLQSEAGSGVLPRITRRENGAALAHGPGRCQYSSGKRKVVTLRSASVMIHSVFSPQPLDGLAGSTG
jgi:hypothetical protein